MACTPLKQMAGNVILDSSGKLKAAKRRILIRIAGAAVEQFKGNFRAQGFVDNVVEPWPEVQRRIKGADGSFAYAGFRGKKYTRADRTRAILVQTGRLRRAIRRAQPKSNTIDIVADVPYAETHNEGTDRVPQRRFIGNSQALNRRALNIIKEEALKAILRK